MLPEKIIFVGVLINLFCSLWYIKNIFHGGIKPNLVSWFMWMLAPFFGFFFMIQAGTGLSALPVFMAGFFSLLIFIFSIFHKNAYLKINNFYLICGLISLTSLILYVFTHNLGISILFAIISDSLAYIPTIIKSWKFPETESSSTYVGGLISNALSMLIIKNWLFSIYSFNISILIMNLVVIFCIYRKKIFK